MHLDHTSRHAAVSHAKKGNTADHHVMVEPLEGRQMFSGDLQVEPVQPNVQEATPENRGGYTFFLQVGDTKSKSVDNQSKAGAGFHPLAVALISTGDSDVVTGICVDQPVLASKQAMRSAITDDGSHALHRHDSQSYAGRPPNALPVAPPPSDGRSVLLIEDDPISQKAMASILKHRGWRVMTASTLAEGMAKLSDHPDNVIVDLMLPDGDGANLVEKIRATHMPVKVAVVTGITEPDRLERIRELNPESLLTKPINMSELLQQLSKGAAH